MNEWPFWSLREFDNAYEAWFKVNIRAPWERARAISYYVAISQGAKINKWEKMFTVPGEKKKKIQKAIARLPTKEEIDFLKNRNKWQTTPF